MKTLRHERRWPSNLVCEYHNDQWIMPAEAQRRGEAGETHVRCPRCGRRAWVRDWHVRRATDGRLRTLIRSLH